MEGGRQADVAKAILSAKNIPYVVAAPLLIQVSCVIREAVPRVGAANQDIGIINLGGNALNVTRLTS